MPHLQSCTDNMINLYTDREYMELVHVMRTVRTNPKTLIRASLSVPLFIPVIDQFIYPIQLLRGFALLHKLSKLLGLSN